MSSFGQFFAVESLKVIYLRKNIYSIIKYNIISFINKQSETDDENSKVNTYIGYKDVNIIYKGNRKEKTLF